MKIDGFYAWGTSAYASTASASAHPSAGLPAQSPGNAATPGKNQKDSASAHPTTTAPPAADAAKQQSNTLPTTATSGNSYTTAASTWGEPSTGTAKDDFALSKAEELLLQQMQRQRNEDEVDIYETMRKREEEEIKLWKKMLEDMQKAREKSKASAKPPNINLGRMTQSLVSAVTASDVRGVISEASRAISTLEASMTGMSEKQRGQVRAMINGAQKLMNRCSRKLQDLGQEEITRSRQKKAEKTLQKKSAEEIKQELRNKMAERARREQRYLLDKFPSSSQPGLQRSFPLHPAQKLDAATEAKIEAMAEAIAVTEAASAGGEAIYTAGDGVVVSAEGGGEAAAAPSASPAAGETL